MPQKFLSNSENGAFQIYLYHMLFWAFHNTSRTRKEPLGNMILLISKSYLYFLSGIAAVVRVDIENALKDDEWSSTDLIQFLKDKYENETSIQKK